MKGSKMKKMKKRILAALLCTTMMLNTGVSAMADGGTAVSSESAHVHTEECYEKSKTDNLICTKAEAAEGHVHGDTCYEVTSTPELICTQAETAGHTHGDSCMETTKNLICGKEEHTHGDGCVETEEVLTCTAEEHTHADGCYEVKTNIVCGQDEVEAHTHGEGCYTAVENKTLKCTLEEVEAHTHNDDCYAWEEKLVCTLPETAPAAEQPEKEEKAEEAAEVNLQNDDETGIKVSVKSTSDVIPEDTKVVVASMEMDEEHETALAEAVSEFEVLGYTAYDISLKDAEDEDITLGENKVEVTIDFEELIPEGINAEEVKDVVLVHITTDEEEKLTAETVGTVEITEEKATVEFEADSFSPYVVTYLSEAEEVVEETVIEEPVVEDITLTYTSEDEAYTVTVTGTPEVLENVAAFEAVPVTDEEKITALTEQLTAKAAEMQKTSLGFENYEIKFLDAEGNEVAVNGEVKVSLSFAEERIPEAATAENVDAVDAALLKTGTDDKGEAVLEEINGLVSAETGAVKEVVYTTEAPEELILAWSGDVYRTLPNYEDDEVVITLAGTEYALQNVVGFNVTPIKEDNEETKEQYAEVAKQLDEKIAEENEANEEEKAVVGFLAYDITLVDAEGNKLEPQGGVKVSMEYKEAAAPESVTEVEEAEVTIHHFEEDEKGEVKQIVDMVAEETIEAGVTTTEKAEVEKAEFVTEGFSVFTITWTREIGDQSFSLGQDIRLLLANGSEYTELEIRLTTIESLNKTIISGEGTPPTLFMDSITLDGDNKALFQITEDGNSYKFVKAIVAKKEGDTYKAKFPAPVVAIQGKNKIVKDEYGTITPVDQMELRYMLEDTGLYRELENTEEIAFVYTAGEFTTTASYCAEDGTVLRDGKNYDFIDLLETGETVSKPYNAHETLEPTDSTITIGNDEYNFAYVAVEHLGERVLPEYIRYNGTEGSERLQYCVTEVTEEGTEEWIDVIDAEVSLVYRHTGTIQTENTAGIVDINLFNYNFNPLGRSGITQGRVGNIYFGTGNNSSDIDNANIGNYAYNKWTGGFNAGQQKVGANLALQGMVKDTLEEGYPVLIAPTNTNVQQSLATLFNPNLELKDAYNVTSQNSKQSYVGLNHLFKKIDEYYRYDSDENYAYYTDKNGNKNFTIYNAIADKAHAGTGNGIINKTNDKYPEGSRGDFMPFVPIGESITDSKNNLSSKSNEKAYHLGMTIGFDFIQSDIQANGQSDEKDMIFRFSGDDDVWVFVDGKLLLDIGGIHSEASGEINFTEGTVTVKAGPKVNKANWGKEDRFNIGDENAFVISSDGFSQSVIDNTTKNFANIYQQEFKSGQITFEPNTAHRLEFFYLERGADMSNCMIEFNLQPTDVRSVEVAKQIVGTDQEEYGDETFTYELYIEDEVESGKENGSGYDKIPKGTKYTVTRIDDKNYFETRKVDENGRFTLKHNEVARFDDINTSLKYYVREVVSSNEKFDVVTVNGNVAQYYDSDGNAVKVKESKPQLDDGQQAYMAESTPVKVKDVKRVLFQNTCAETNKQNLYIQKLFEGNTELLPEDATFTFKVLLEDRDGNMVPYNGKYFVNSVNGTGLQTTDGKISGIAVGQTVIITDLMEGTDFYVEEIELGSEYQKPAKVVVNKIQYLNEEHTEDKFGCISSNIEMGNIQGVEYYADGVIVGNKDAKVKITNAFKFDWEIIKISSSKDADGNDVFLKDAEFELQSTTTGKVYIGESDPNGKIVWGKIKESEDSQPRQLKDDEQIEVGSYILQETKAPTGYVLSEKEWQVVVTQTSVSIKEKLTDTDGSYGEELFKVKTEADGNVLYNNGSVCYTATIINTPLYELPSTGGHGIYTTMLSGFALMLGAAYVWFTSRRKESSND